MSGQSARGKYNGNVNYALLSGSPAAGSTTRRSVLKYPKSTTNAESLAPLVDLLASSCGCNVVATVASGARYLGLLVTADISSTGNAALSVVLANPKLTSKSLIDEKSNADENLPQRLVIQGKDLIDVEVVTTVADNKDSQTEKSMEPESAAPTVDKVIPATKPISYSELTKKTAKPTTLTAPAFPTTDSSNATSEKSKEPSPLTKTERKLSSVRLEDKPKAETSKFKTDRDISAGYKFEEREFERWQPEAGSVELTLEDNSGGNGAWDQFKVNEEKFGVESTYDEHLYTTRVNTLAKDYNERLQRAQKIAREIEGLTTLDHHVLEERGIAVADDSGMDEEDKYSGVLADTQPAKIDMRGSELMAALRSGTSTAVTRSNTQEPKSHVPGAGKYVTPGQRAANYHNDPAIVSSSATKKPVTPVPASSSSNTTIPPKPNVLHPVSSSGKTHKDLKDSFRLNAQSEINSLKEFSASFKVPHKMPNDLLPILAKDKVKQDEILKKLEAPKETVKDEPKEPRQAMKEEAKDVKESNDTKDSKDIKDSKDTKDTTESKESAKQPLSTLLSRKLSTSTVDGARDGSKFKLNPKAAAFTPSRGIQASPQLSNKSVVSSPRMPTPKMPGAIPNVREKKPHVMTALEFFKSQDKVPTVESQKEKLRRFQESFNMFNTIVKEHEKKVEKEGTKAPPLVFPKMYMTPPTWDSTVDESYEKVITDQCMMQAPASSHPGMPFMGNTMMGMPGGPQMVPGFANLKFPVSPSMQHSMAQFQHQQMQAAMFYQMQASASGRPAPQMMYMPPGADPQYIAPGFVVPNGMMGTHGHMSPTYSGSFEGVPIVSGSSYDSPNGYNSHNHPNHNPSHSHNPGHTGHTGHTGHSHYNQHNERFDKHERGYERSERHERPDSRAPGGHREYQNTGYNGNGNGNRRYFNQKRGSYNAESRG